MTSVSVCLSICVCLSAITAAAAIATAIRLITTTICVRNYASDLHQFLHVTSGRGSVLLWGRNDTLCTSGFMDDVILARKPRLLDVAAQLKHSAHATVGLATNCPQ